MKTEFIKRYNHTWGIFERVVQDFNEDAWLRTGRKAMIPARLAFHILKAVKYYLEDTSTLVFESGKSFENNPETTDELELPSRSDIKACIGELKTRTEKWLCEIDFNAANSSFSWAGETKLGVAMFSLHHCVYHLGELSSLLNESRNGETEDNYVKAL